MCISTIHKKWIKMRWWDKDKVPREPDLPKKCGQAPARRENDKFIPNSSIILDQWSFILLNIMKERRGGGEPGLLGCTSWMVQRWWKKIPLSWPDITAGTSDLCRIIDCQQRYRFPSLHISENRIHRQYKHFSRMQSLWKSGNSRLYIIRHYTHSKVYLQLSLIHRFQRNHLPRTYDNHSLSPHLKIYLQSECTHHCCWGLDFPCTRRDQGGGLGLLFPHTAKPTADQQTWSQ